MQYAHYANFKFIHSTCRKAISVMVCRHWSSFKVNLEMKMWIAY